MAAWGHGRYARRAEALAERFGAPLLRFEDPFLRSLRAGRDGEPPLGLLIDRQRAHFDPSGPSDLEDILRTHPLAAADDGALAEMRETGLTKYAATLDLDPLARDAVLVIDQTRGDASVRLSGACGTTFAAMLQAARDDHPGRRIVVKAHPETAGGHRPGHIAEGPGLSRDARPVTPATLFRHAAAVYTVSSQLGFEAILHGHRPVVFGQPFYAGWGLTEDRALSAATRARRTRRLTAAQLFDGAMRAYPVWHDPHRDARCGPLDAVRVLEARRRAWREDRAGWCAPGLRLWKRAPTRRFLSGRLGFRDDPSRARVVWGTQPDPPAAAAARCGWRTGSSGRGAWGPLWSPPCRWCWTARGCTTTPGIRRTWMAISRAASRPPERLDRARRLRESIVAAAVTKYNLAGGTVPLPPGYVLVIGQVEDDASVRLGADADEAALLRAARAAHPGATLVFKPHPDVEAGLRRGRTGAREADVVARGAALPPLIEGASRVWTLTSTAGFEALLRGVPVTVMGRPFYAGWGLTRDLGGPMPRRHAASLDALVHGALIDAPRYHDPVTGTACPPEAAIHRLASGDVPAWPALRILSKAQGVLASLRAGPRSRPDPP